MKLVIFSKNQFYHDERHGKINITVTSNFLISKLHHTLFSFIGGRVFLRLKTIKNKNTSSWLANMHVFSGVKFKKYCKQIDPVSKVTSMDAHNFVIVTFVWGSIL